MAVFEPLNLLAGYLVEKITGQTWEQYTRRTVLGLLGMDDADFDVDTMQQAQKKAVLECGRRNFRILRCPIRRRERHVPEIRSGRGKFEPDLALAVVLVVNVRDAAGLFLAGVGIANDQSLTHSNFRHKMNEPPMSTDDGRVRFFRNGLFIVTNGDDKNAHAKQDALTAATIAHGSEIRR